MPRPTALTAEFTEHPEKARQWQAFVSRNKLDVGDMSLASLIAKLSEFLVPPWQAIAKQQLFKATWGPQGPWQIED